MTVESRFIDDLTVPVDVIADPNEPATRSTYGTAVLADRLVRERAAEFLNGGLPQLRHLAGQHSQKSHGGGATGDAALAAAPLRLVDNKKDPILGTVKSKPGRDMTMDEARSLSSFRESGFVPINRSLRKSGGELPKGSYGKTTTNIDSAMKKSPLLEDVSVERGIGNGPKMFGDRWQSDLTGTTFIDHGFVSTTASRSIAGEFADRIPGVSDGALTRVHVPAGVSAIQLSGREHESELLLNRGLTYEITSDTGPGADRRITMAVRQ